MCILAQLIPANGTPAIRVRGKVSIPNPAKRIAIATRHADAIDIKFLASGRPVWIALPHPTWVEYKERTGRVITDPLAIQIAGHFLKTAIESGTYEHGREMYTLTVDESLEHLNAVLKEVGAPHDALIKTA